MIENLSYRKFTDIARARCRIGSADRARQGCRARASRDGFTASQLSQYGNARHQYGDARHQCGNARDQRGFTLVEMVAVIVLLSFGLIAGSQLFEMTAESYRDTSSRMKMTQDGRFVVERISRELRDALPGSVRVTGQCVEWMPIVAASRYLTLPQTTPATSLTVMKLAHTLPSLAPLYAVVFPVGANTIYSGAAPGSAVQLLTVTPVTYGAQTDQINLQSATLYTVTSPAERVYIVTAPVSICVHPGGDMRRHSDYGFVAAPTDLVAASGVLLAENVLLSQGGPAINVFNYTDMTLTRNAMLEMDIRLERNNDVLRLQHTVFIRNSP